MYPSHHRKTRSKQENQQLLKGIAFVLAAAICVILLILGGILN